MLKLGAITLFGCLLAVPGCGGNRFPVSTVEGIVSVDGEPIGDGSVIFNPLESNTGQAIAADLREGKYHSKKVPRGKSLVIINVMKDTGEKHVEFGITYPKPKNMVPEKYRSGIELDVNAPTMTHNFELQSK